VKEVPLFSICITSYNRVDELYRCLNSIDAIHPEEIEIVISEDCSPKKDEIHQMVEKFISETSYKVKYNSNIENIGYDQNLGKLINLANGNYILFISDDDMFLKGGIDKLINFTNKNNFSVAFTPYFHQKTGVMGREYSKTFLIEGGFSGVRKHLFDSILFSGLIFKRDKVINYQPKRFKNLIYSQVYLFCTMLLTGRGFYINIPLIHCIEDGENAFGLNESGERNEIMANRSSPLSNLEYHKSLIKIIKIFDEENKTNLINFFSREYSLRSYTGMLIARKIGQCELRKYWDGMNSLGIKIHTVSFIYFYMLLFFGSRFSNTLSFLPKKILLKIRSMLV
jgi:abequosyltransferase